LEERGMPPWTRRAIRSERLHLRLTPAEKRRIQAAAEAESKALTTFVLDSALSAADRLLASRHRLGLSAEQWKAFIAALDAPPRSQERPLRKPLF
jgi:uncharacterized protein (DUF1778 family)